MATVNYGGNYSSNLAREKRRRFFIRLGAAVFCGIFLGMAVGYTLFYSGWMRITSISVNGLKSVAEDQISPSVEGIIQKNILPILKIRSKDNILFFNPEPIRESILAQFPVIKDVQIVKKFPHELVINIVERNPLGTWCFVEKCAYFDEDGVLWGNALKSSGALLLGVEDMRALPENEQNKIDRQLLNKIRGTITALESQKLKIRKIEIDSNSVGDFKVHMTGGYYLVFNIESDIEHQANILKVFLQEKGEDFKPEYIDLRIRGRVYYK